MKHALFIFLAALMYFQGIAQERTSIIQFNNAADSTAVRSLISHARNISNAYPDSAYSLLQQALKSGIRHHYRKEENDARYEIMALYYNHKQYKATITAAQLLIDNCDSSAYPIVICEAYLCIGMSYEGLESFADALKTYQTALHYAIDSLHKKYVYGNMSSVLFNTGQYGKATVYLEKALVFSPKPDPILLYKRAYLYMSDSNASLALKYFDSAFHTATLVSDKANILFRKIIYLSEQHQGQEAVHEFVQLNSLPDKNSLSKEQKAQILLAGGAAYYSIKNNRQALSYLRKAQVLYSYLRKQEQRVLLHKLSDVYYAMGYYKEAYDLHKKTHEMEDSVKKSDVLNKVNELETKYGTAQKDQLIAQQKTIISERQKQLYLALLWSGGIIAALIIISLLLGIRFFYQKQKNQQLKSEQTFARLQAKIEAEENERIRISGELHDGLGVLISAAKLNNTLLKKNIGADPQRMQSICTDGASILDNIHQEMRSIAHNLNPEYQLSHKGLYEALTQLTTKLESDAFHIRISVYDEPQALHPQRGLIVYRIMEEVINNSLRHSQGSLLDIQLVYTDTDLNITAEDNGSGFDVAVATRGIGLHNIERRVAQLGGHLILNSGKGKGSVYMITIPYEGAV